MAQRFKAQESSYSHTGTDTGDHRGGDIIHVRRGLGAGIYTFSLDRERGTAAAGGCGIGVAYDELGTFKSLAVVNLRPGQVLYAGGINEKDDPALFQLGVPILDFLIKGEAILEAGAAAA